MRKGSSNIQSQHQMIKQMKGYEGEEYGGLGGLGGCDQIEEIEAEIIIEYLDTINEFIRANIGQKTLKKSEKSQIV